MKSTRESHSGCVQRSDDYRVVVAGDFCPIGRADHPFAPGEAEEAFRAIANVMAAAEFRIVNLECPLTDACRPEGKTGPSLRAAPDGIRLIRVAGFDMVTLANNHIMDYGPRGLHQTLDVCRDAGVQWVGAGRNLSEASLPRTVSGGSHPLTILNAAEQEFGVARGDRAGMNPQDLIDLHRQILGLKERGHAVLLILHGGHEFHPFPSPATVKRMRFLAEAGASAIVAHHTHCISGHEVHAGVPIFYGLGNFLFDLPGLHAPDWDTGALLSLTFSGGRVREWVISPIRQRWDRKFAIDLPNGAERESVLMRIAMLSAVIADPVRLEASFEAFCRASAPAYRAGLVVPNRWMGWLYRRFGWRSWLAGKARLRMLLNLMRCEAHREACLRILEEDTREPGEDARHAGTEADR